MDKYGRLTILQLYLKQDGNQKNTFALCECDCGETKEVRLKHLKDESIVSCGCNKAEKASETCIKRNTAYEVRNMSLSYARVIDSQMNGMWIQDKSKDGINDVHVYTQKAQDNSIVLGHNTKDMAKINGTPLAIILGSEKEGIRLQYKTGQSIDNIGVDVEVFSRHFLTFLKAVRDETCSKPLQTTPSKPAELEE